MHVHTFTQTPFMLCLGLSRFLFMMLALDKVVVEPLHAFVAKDMCFITWAYL